MPAPPPPPAALPIRKARTLLANCISVIKLRLCSATVMSPMMAVAATAAVSPLLTFHSADGVAFRIDSRCHLASLFHFSSVERVEYQQSIDRMLSCAHQAFCNFVFRCRRHSASPCQLLVCPFFSCCVPANQSREEESSSAIKQIDTLLYSGQSVHSTFTHLHETNLVSFFLFSFHRLVVVLFVLIVSVCQRWPAFTRCTLEICI